MKSFIFWQRWLFYSSLLFALFGALIAVYGSNPLFQPCLGALGLIFWQQQNIPVEAVQFRSFISGPLGEVLHAAISCSLS